MDKDAASIGACTDCASALGGLFPLISIIWISTIGVVDKVDGIRIGCDDEIVISCWYVCPLLKPIYNCGTVWNDFTK